MFRNQFPPFFSVLHHPLGLGELQACPFPDVVFPPLPLSALSSSPPSLWLARWFWPDLMNGSHVSRSFCKYTTIIVQVCGCSKNLFLAPRCQLYSSLPQWVPRKAVNLPSFFTRFWSDSHVVSCWLVERMIILSLIPAFKWTGFASFDCGWYLSSSLNVYDYFWRFCSRSTPVFLPVAML